MLPLRVLGAGGFYADHFDRCRILLTSLSKFTAADFFETIFVVAPPREFPDVATFCRTWNSLPLTVINEEGLLPALRDFPDLMGWYRQQLIKLAAANLVNTEFFLTLDADVILCKPLQIEICAIRQGTYAPRGSPPSHQLVEQLGGSSWGGCQSLNAGDVSYASDPVADDLPTIVFASEGEIWATLGIRTNATNRRGMDRIYFVLFDRRALRPTGEVSRDAARCPQYAIALPQ